MTTPIINPAALEPLFAPHEEPNFHRVRADKAGEPAKVEKGRRPSSITVANNLRSLVKAWREAIESLMYLWEVRGVRSLSNIISEFWGDDRETAALGVHPEEDLWARYAFKLSTGTGKTKGMSLAIVWSYFHSLHNIDSAVERVPLWVWAMGLDVFKIDSRY